jgi:adenine-specific DNA-methyltransferase
MPVLNWIGKDAVARHDAEVPFRLLHDVPELACGDADSGNLIVEGDNLLALKALLPHYGGQVKCIYIDPPYNTGNEGWVYNDNVNSPQMREWLGKVVGKEAEDLTRHDKWLCMMYPRLKLLRRFLREDGAIFVSIDDNEVASLRMLLDEIFGKKNFVAQFVWNTEGHTDNQFHVKVNHEYIVMYAMKEVALDIGYVVDPNTPEGSNLWAGFAENSITKNGPVNPPSEVELPIGFPVKEPNLHLEASEIPANLIEAMTTRRMSSNQLKAEFGRVQFPLRLDPMVAKNGRLIRTCRVFSGWANARKLRSFIDAGCTPIEDDDQMKVGFFLSGNGVVYYHKERGERARNILSVLRNLGTTEKMRSELEGFGIKFQYPKPKELLQYIVRIGSGAGDLILDSFAGSGTTAHAVLKQNSEDGGNRRCILVEMDSNIARDVTAERVKRVAQGYTNAKGEVVPGLGGGFHYATVGKSLFAANGHINPEVTFAEMARFVWFMETGTPLASKRPSSPLLGVHEGRAVYLLYNGILKDKSTGGGNTLTSPLLAELPPHEGPKTVYGTRCLIRPERLRGLQLAFKQLPYELKVAR